MLIHALTAYLIAFALSWWPSIAHHRYQDREMRAIAEEVAEAGGTPMEDLRLMNIAAMESNFDRKAIGRHGERGAWQIMPPAREYGAREALRRMREQGMSGYCGCVRPGRRVTGLECPLLVAHRIDKADLYLMAFDPPSGVDELATKPEFGSRPDS